MGGCEFSGARKQRAPAGIEPRRRTAPRDHQCATDEAGWPDPSSSDSAPKGPKTGRRSARIRSLQRRAWRASVGLPSNRVLSHRRRSPVRPAAAITGARGSIGAPESAQARAPAFAYGPCARLGTRCAIKSRQLGGRYRLRRRAGPIMPLHTDAKPLGRPRCERQVRDGVMVETGASRSASLLSSRAAAVAVRQIVHRSVRAAADYFHILGSNANGCGRLTRIRRKSR